MDVTFWLSSMTRMAKMQSSGKASNQLSETSHNEAILYGTLWSHQAHTAAIIAPTLFLTPVVQDTT